MAHPKAALLWLVACLFSLVAVAEPKGAVTVFPFDFSSARIDRGSQVALEEGVRSIVADALAPQGYNVLTGDTQLRLMQDNGVDLGKVCDANCSLSAAREIKAAYFITGICSSSEGQYICFVRLFRAKDGQQLASVELGGSTVREVREKLKTQAGALLGDLAPELAPTVAMSDASPVASHAATGGVQSGHELRRGSQASDKLRWCDSNLLAAFDNRNRIILGASGRAPTMAAILPTLVPSDTEMGSLMADCARTFGPLYAYEPAAKHGETPQRSLLAKPPVLAHAQCLDLSDRVAELEAIRLEYVSGRHADDLDARRQARLYGERVEQMKDLTKYCQK